MYVCMYVCTPVYEGNNFTQKKISTWVYNMGQCMYVYMYVYVEEDTNRYMVYCMGQCMYVYICIYVYECICVCTYCMYVCMCMYV